MDAVSSAYDCSFKRNQRGISAPHASENRTNLLKLAIGIIPGIIGISTPRPRTSSTKRAIGAYLIADQLTIVGLGETVAVNLGIDRNVILWAGLVIVALITSLVVVTVGNIPFIGLVVPNIVSRIMGDKLRAGLPAVALLGTALVLLCDVIGRVIVFPFEIPVATVFGVLGTVLFLGLLMRQPAR